jgi:hypothetical protein
MTNEFAASRMSARSGRRLNSPRQKIRRPTSGNAPHIVDREESQHAEGARVVPEGNYRND